MRTEFAPREQIFNSNFRPACEIATWLMRVHRQAIVGVRVNAMKFFAGLLHRVDVDDNIREVADVMHRLMPHFLGNGVPFFDGKSRRNLL